MLRFQHYLACLNRPWSLQDECRYLQYCASLEQQKATEDALLHSWIVDSLNKKWLDLRTVAVWLMQYAAGQVVVASRWLYAPRETLSLLYPDWTMQQNIKASLNLPWYNGAHD